MAPERKLLSGEEIKKTLTRLAHEVLEKNAGSADKIVLVGIRTCGVFLAERLQALIQEIHGKPVPLGVLDITLYRDDLIEVGPNPLIRETRLDIDLEDRIVVLVDDVLYTGRTVRAALSALTDYGRPEAVRLAVLIDRGHRELPIRADYVGKNVPTAQNEEVVLRMQERDGVDEAVIREIGAA